MGLTWVLHKALGIVPDHRIIALDGLRGLAIAYVMLGHFGPGWLHAAGSFGVTVFFALSGRLMADVLFIGNMDWREFAIRRLARLYPALVSFLACMFILSELLHRTDLLAYFWCYPIFSVNILAMAKVERIPFDHLWSVSLEVQSYIVLALIATIVSGPKRLATLFIGAIFCFTNGLLQCYATDQSPIMIYWRPDVGAATVFAAAFLRLLLKDVPIPSWMTPIAFGMANGLALYTTEPWVAFALNGVLLAFVAATAERSGNPLLRLFQSRPLIFLGTISYSLYIWQQLFMYAHRGGLPLILAVGFSVLTATFSYDRIERPGKDAILFLWRRYATNDVANPTHH